MLDQAVQTPPSTFQRYSRGSLSGSLEPDASNVALDPSCTVYGPFASAIGALCAEYVPVTVRADDTVTGELVETPSSARARGSTHMKIEKM